MKQYRIRLEKKQRFSSLLFYHVDERVVSDAIQPRRKFSCDVEALNIRVRFDKDSLNRVLDVIIIEKELPTVPQHFRLVPLYENAKGLRIAGLYLFCNTFIGGFLQGVGSHENPLLLLQQKIRKNFTVFCWRDSYAVASSTNASTTSTNILSIV